MFVVRSCQKKGITDYSTMTRKFDARKSMRGIKLQLNVRCVRPSPFLSSSLFKATLRAPLARVAWRNTWVHGGLRAF